MASTLLNLLMLFFSLSFLEMDIFSRTQLHNSPLESSICMYIFICNYVLLYLSIYYILYIYIYVYTYIICIYMYTYV